MLIQFCLTFHVLYSFLVHVKHLINVTNPKVHTKGNRSLLLRTLLLNCLQCHVCRPLSSVKAKINGELSLLTNLK